MKCIVLILSLIVLSLNGAVHAQMKGDTYYLPDVDVLAEKNKAAKTKGAMKYGINSYVSDIKVSNGITTKGVWQDLENGYSEWSINIQADNATSLDFGFKDFYLPPTAELTVINADQTVVKGPYTGSVNKKHGYFWPGTVPGDHAKVNVKVSNKYKPYLKLNLFNIPRGFYKFWEQPIVTKSLECNIDVNCSEGDDWQSQSNSVAHYSFNTPTGGFVCTGQLINNTLQDGTPYFLTANHCGHEDANNLEENQAIAASMNIWWNYQSLSCRAPGSTQSGIQISLSGFNDTQSGATYISNNAASDFALVRLNENPLPNYGTEFTGWDRRDIAPNFAFSIHHPLGHAKRIAIENNPLSITSPLGISNTHLRVNEWDQGLTEQGSSGGGLWNADGLLIGQLHFGNLAETCADPVSDSYGRFNTSWEQGNTPQSRLKDWLDPNNTGQQTLQGTGGCEAPTVSIINTSSNSVGDLLTFSSQVSGGAGGYTYEWDVNADGELDGMSAAVQARYNHQFVGNIQLTVKDSAGCQANASRAVVIINADVQLEQVNDIPNSLVQVCGNNDTVIDPGERWSATLAARNSGAQTASDAYLALGKNRRSTTGQSDSFGNSISSCDRLFIDISGTGTLHDWELASNVNNAAAEDEGSVLIELSQAFDHYGENVSQVRVSTNGFISTSADATGGDWDNDCPLPQAPDKDNTGARIAPMHDDLKDSMFYHQSFNSCPRPAETGVDLACEVFMWQGADLFNTQNTVEAIDVQAILYPATSQWVYQYAGNGLDGAGATIGMQNLAADDGLTFACDTANSINVSEAVCVFNKNNQPASSAADFVRLESPVISLGSLLVNGSQSRDLNFAISEDATCGSSFSINHEASVFDEGFNAGQNNILTQDIGNNGQCNVVTNCGVGNSGANTNDIVPRRGLWWNPDRDGNGLDMYSIDNESLLYFFYTGKADGEPIWYLANDADSAHNQYYNNILEFSVPGGFENGTLENTAIGWSNTSFIDNSTAIQVRVIDGLLSAEKQYFFQYGADETPNLHTGPFFTPSENGWGHSVGTLGDSRVALTFIYDDDGNPYWTIGSGPNNNSAFDISYVNSFCHSCPSRPTRVETAGQVQMTLNGQIDGTLVRYNVDRDNVNWNKTNLPLQAIIAPE